MKHHYIPAWYLKHWANPQTGQLVEFTRFQGRVKALRRAPAATGYKIDLYAIFGGGEQRHIFESGFLRGIDTEAARIGRGMIAGRDPSATDRAHWVRFLMSLMARSPEALAMIRTHAAEWLASKHEEFGTREGADKGAGYEPQPLADYVEGDSSRMSLDVIRNVCNDTATGSLLRTMSWASVTLDTSSHRFFTSDRPILMSNGLGKPDGQLILPLSPRMAFIATRTESTMRDIFRVQPSAFAAQVNEWVVRQAVEHVYGSNDAGLRFVERRMSDAAKRLYVDYDAAARFAERGTRAPT